MHTCRFILHLPRTQDACLPWTLRVFAFARRDCSTYAHAHGFCFTSPSCYPPPYRHLPRYLQRCLGSSARLHATCLRAFHRALCLHFGSMRTIVIAYAFTPPPSRSPAADAHVRGLARHACLPLLAGNLLGTHAARGHFPTPPVRIFVTAARYCCVSFT